MRKKLFTFLLALAASVGMMWAQGPWTSGDCTLTLSGGVMTVSGNGAMADYGTSNPWKSYNSSITSIVIEDGVTHVGNGTFPQCTSLVSVVIGDDVETIGEFTFDDAGASLTSVTMGNKVKSIGMAAFLWDTGLSELILSEDLETIGDYAFCRMEALTTITIPSKVTSIGAAAFSNCSALQSIYIEATTPPTLGNGVFASVNADLSTIPLYVPSGSVAAYEAAAQWTDFDIQGYDPAPVVPTGVDVTANQDGTTGVYYATFYDSSKKYALPNDGTEAYAAEVSDNAMYLHKIAENDDVLPANTAVILKATSGSITLTESDETPVTVTATNNLHGVDADTEIATVVLGTCYVLSGGSEGVGFYRYQAPNQLKAHKAYIDLNGSGAAQAPKRLRFIFDNATGIDNTEANVKAEKLIENGQLVIIKNGVRYNAQGMIVK
jgi:hypothetical protein